MYIIINIRTICKSNRKGNSNNRFYKSSNKNQLNALCILQSRVGPTKVNVFAMKNITFEVLLEDKKLDYKIKFWKFFYVS